MDIDAIHSAIGAWRELVAIAGDGGHVSVTLDCYTMPDGSTSLGARLSAGGASDAVIRTFRACRDVRITPYKPAPGEYHVEAQFAGLPVSWHCFRDTAAAILAAFATAEVRS